MVTFCLLTETQLIIFISYRTSSNHERPNYLKNMNEDFIEKKLCRDARRYLKVYSENFEEDMKKAMDSVISQIGAMRDPISQ